MDIAIDVAIVICGIAIIAADGKIKEMIERRWCNRNECEKKCSGRLYVENWKGRKPE